MSDEFSNWQRSGGKPDPKKPVDVKWRATHGAPSRRDDDPYKAEANRDRLIFFWTLGVLILAGILAYVMFFLTDAPEK